MFEFRFEMFNYEHIISIYCNCNGTQLVWAT